MAGLGSTIFSGWFQVLRVVVAPFCKATY